MKIRIFCFAAIMLLTTGILGGCGASGKQYTTALVSAEPTFNDIFLSFSDLRAVGNELMNEPLSDEWWAKYDGISQSIEAIVSENSKLLGGSTLSETDRQLASVLNSALDGYREGFKIIEAVRESDNSDIISYAMTEFSTKLVTANTVWDTAVSAITAG